MRLIRVIEYIGPQEWIEAMKEKNYAQAEVKHVGPGRTIQELAYVESEKEAE